MDKVAQLPAQDRSDLFRAAAEEKGVSVQLIEKDFWVCWVLKHLGRLPDDHPGLFFKGGTSLSKVFGVIERMSEDIDLVIDREALGFTGEKNPADPDLTNKARERLIDALKQEAAGYVENRLFPALRTLFAGTLTDDGTWSLETDVSNLDNTTIAFRFPSTQEASPYLKPMVLLELGARGDTTPTVDGNITPYSAEVFPGAFEISQTSVPTITAQRTFWEKATYLHALAHQGAEKIVKAKPARHYYDLYQLLGDGLGQQAMADLVLLEDVRTHKTRFFRQGSAKYDLAVPGTFRLVPDEDGQKPVRSEYARLAEEMVFGEAPAFEEIIDRLQQAEDQLNS